MFTISRPSTARSTTSSSLKGKNSTDDISLKDIVYLLYSLMTIHSEIQPVKWLPIIYSLIFYMWPQRIKMIFLLQPNDNKNRYNT